MAAKPRKPAAAPAAPDLATLGGIIGRQALTAAGTYAVTKGYVDADTATQLGGAVLAIGATAWSFWQKKRAAKG